MSCRGKGLFLSLILLRKLCRPRRDSLLVDLRLTIVEVSPDFSSNISYNLPMKLALDSATLIKLSTWLSDFVTASVQCCK